MICACLLAIARYGDCIGTPVLGAFTSKRSLAGLSVAVVDDVMTTGSSLQEVARSLKLAGAIRAVDRRHLITVGEIPWSLTFPGAKPLFSDRETGRVLDFASIHVYPKAGESERAMTALRSHALGRPVLIEDLVSDPSLARRAGPRL